MTIFTGAEEDWLSAVPELHHLVGTHEFIPRTSIGLSIPGPR